MMFVITLVAALVAGFAVQAVTGSLVAGMAGAVVLGLLADSIVRQRLGR